MFVIITIRCNSCSCSERCQRWNGKVAQASDSLQWDKDLRLILSTSQLSPLGSTPPTHHHHHHHLHSLLLTQLTTNTTTATSVSQRLTFSLREKHHVVDGGWSSALPEDRHPFLVAAKAFDVILYLRRKITDQRGEETDRWRKDKWWYRANNYWWRKEKKWSMRGGIRYWCGKVINEWTNWKTDAEKSEELVNQPGYRSRYNVRKTDLGNKVVT